MFIIPKNLNKVLDMWREIVRVEEERLREYVLINLCFVISKDEIARILKLEKNEFRSKMKSK